MSKTTDHKTTVNGGDGKVHFQIDPTTGKAMFWQGAGESAHVATFDLPSAQGGDGASLLLMPEEKASLARSLLLDFRTGRFDALQPLHIEVGDMALDVQVKTLSDADWVEVSAMMSSRGQSLADFATVGGQAAFFASLLAVATVASEDARQRYFETLEEAEMWQREPGMSCFVAPLTAAIFARNPYLKRRVASHV